jgi:KaiC/GvpD/RAD55 family RecA-like ATPase
LERIKTGIPGFDELIQGGIPKGFNVLITGPPGAGKSIFSMQYLYNGALAGDPGLYLSLDSPKKNMIEQASQFGWDFEKLENENLISFFSIPPDRTRLNLFDMIEDIVAQTKAKRLAFDSLATLMISIDQFAIPVSRLNQEKDVKQDLTITPSTSTKKVNPLDYELLPNAEYDQKGRVFYSGNAEKRMIYLIMHELQTLGTTNVVITSSPEKETSKLTVDGVSEFAADGVISLEVQEIAKKIVRSIRVRKMRNTNQDLDSFTFSLLNNGIIIEGKKIFEGSKISGINP